MSRKIKPTPNPTSGSWVYSCGKPKNNKFKKWLEKRDLFSIIIIVFNVAVIIYLWIRRHYE